MGDIFSSTQQQQTAKNSQTGVQGSQGITASGRGKVNASTTASGSASGTGSATVAGKGNVSLSGAGAQKGKTNIQNTAKGKGQAGNGNLQISAAKGSTVTVTTPQPDNYAEIDAAMGNSANATSALAQLASQALTLITPNNSPPATPADNTPVSSASGLNLGVSALPVDTTDPNLSDSSNVTQPLTSPVDWFNTLSSGEKLLLGAVISLAILLLGFALKRK